jgi:hypothetical protein
MIARARAAIDKTRARWRRFELRVDEERAETLQRVYYPMLVVAGLYCWLGSDEMTKPLTKMIGEGPLTAFTLGGFIGLHLVCPVLTLIGRRLTARTATIPAGEPNPGVGAALLQLSGDGGILGAILIYFGCIVGSFEWGQPMYTTFYFLMGVPGGFLFTLRSWRRWKQIQRRGKRIIREALP